jgi:multidrug efflux pump subunit AcrA (membrane-fusion protein)
MNAQVAAAESALKTAKLNLDNRKTSFESSKALFEASAISENEFDLAETAYTNAQNGYSDALVSLDVAKNAEKRGIDTAKAAVDSAQVNYNNALNTLSLASQAADSELSRYKSNVTSSQIMTNAEPRQIAIQQLEKKLTDSIITAPAAGTITASYAKVGANGTGLLFVIEDTEHLKVITKVKEYDVDSVKPGIEVTIKSDSTGNDVYDGVVTKVSPTAVKNSSGDTMSASAAATDVEFEAEIRVLSDSTKLKIGMNTTLTLALEKKADAFYVSYDAVMTGRNNESAVFSIFEALDIEGGQPFYHVNRIPVTTGVESDMYVEIIGAYLTEGMKVVNDAALVKDGMQVELR